MLTLYTAIGQLTTRHNLTKDLTPLVLMNQEEYALSPHELVLWSCLAFQILTKSELRERYEAGLRTQHLASDPDFEHYLRRLLLRGILVSGTGYTGADALYRLLGTLYMVPVKNTAAMRLYECFHRIASGKLIRSAIKDSFQTPDLKRLDALILKLAKTFHFSVAELLGYMELQAKPENTDEVFKQIYADADDTCDTLADKMQIDHTQFPILQSVGNLYLHRQILLTRY
ncbi:MAG: cell division protein [Hespellia sp.]|nr:cell division protein [Hespellia sp.]